MTPRTALITGASSGIGMAIARVLAARGTEVALCARRERPMLDLQAEIARQGGRARLFIVDVADPQSTTSTLVRADDEMGGIELVVANAGVGKACWGGSLTWEACREIVAVNVSGAVATLTALVPRMVARKRGHLVGISSLAGYRGLPRNAAYCASKAFLSTFLESLRIDLTGTGLVVTDVRPGFVRTAMTEQQDFERPFLMQADEAARIIVSAIDRQLPVVAFPWQLALAARSSRLLPGRLYRGAVARALRPRKPR